MVSFRHLGEILIYRAYYSSYYKCAHINVLLIEQFPQQITIANTKDVLPLKEDETLIYQTVITNTQFHQGERG